MLTAGNPLRRRPKPIHLAALVRRDGSVSPFCVTRPMAINLRWGTWTLTRSQVTCKKCLKKMVAPA